ncbi:MAG: O-antigen ligase family protein [Hyphomicrobiales bacterium]
MTHAATFEAPAQPRITMGMLRNGLVAMVFVSSFLSKFEPAPTDFFLILAVIAAITGGLRLAPAIVPLFLFLLIYNLSGVISYMQVPYDIYEGYVFLVGLALTSSSAIFVAAYVADDPARRFILIRNAYWVGATIGGILGLISYFKIPPLYAVFPDFAGRAVGGYKDPNVFSTWLVPPVVFMLQGFVMGHIRVRLLSVVSFVIMFSALFLAFSRGAWVNAVMSSALTLGFTFVLSPSSGLRRRMGVASIIGVVLLAVMLIAMLSIPTTRDLFLDRFTLVKSYDAGETGRFGNQINSLPMLLDRPFGFGPYQFVAIFNLAPHNTFLNSFSSCGWIGGITYIVLVVCNMFVGFRTMLIRTPFQPYAIAAYSCLVYVTFQGVQIDTEHWRHMYWMMGLTWGFFAASFAYVHRPPPDEQIAQAWALAPRRK